MSVRRIPAVPVQEKEADGRRVTVTIDVTAQRLDRALADALSNLPGGAPSRSRLKNLIASGAVSSDGVTISDPSLRVKPGQIFTISFPDATPPDLAPQEMPLSIVYEDMHLIVVDKPAGLVVHPAPGNPDRTLVNALLAHCGPSLSGIGGVARPGIVHRLDKDTSGLLVAAKTEAAHRHLAEQFAKHTVERVYAAIVWGVPRPREGQLSGAIGRSRGDRKKMTVRRDGGGKPALTRYRVVRSLAGGAASLIECRLATGRTHQIRVHLAGAGHPLIGDPVYGRPARRRSLPPKLAARAEGWTRQALDAFVLGFVHPESGKKLRFSKEYDSYINVIINSLDKI
jgi:23S rRNA pseudouridine1911/1915/1917 synthase